jgi:molecular chaperone GrpE
MSDINPILDEQPTPPSEEHFTDEQAQNPGAPASGGSDPAAAARVLEADSLEDAEEDAEALQGDVDTPFGAHGELVAVAKQRDEYLALAQRTQADFENYRKRIAKEAAAAQERGTSALAKELLPALDNLDRALDAADSEDPLLEGVRLVRAELSAGLTRAGIESFSPAGEPFDPALHEAVATAPAPDGSPSGTVLEVYQPGYKLGTSIIRPARVVVAA